MNDPISFNALPWFIKVFAAVVGAIFALVLSSDIDEQGRIKITLGVVLKFTMGVSVSLYGGTAIIEYYALNDYSVMTHGFIMLLMAVFGMLMLGILYQSIALLKGKSLIEIVSEVKSAFTAIFTK